MNEGQQSRQLWVVSDGKPGHVNQSLGLADALCHRRPGLQVCEIPATRGVGSLLRSLLGRRRRGDRPALIIGAGHGTHASLLALRRKHGGRTVVLMRPSLPTRLFDLCIEPRHDGGEESERRWLSDGPLNRMRPAAERDEGGVILLGGPSPHFHWDNDAVLAQISHICSGESDWQLSSSRRTPPDLLPRLRDARLPRLKVLDARDLPPSWLADTLPRAGQCWVSPDSASMVFEALSAGCAVGVLELERQAGSKVAAAIHDLHSRGLCRSYGEVVAGVGLELPRERFSEADRMAERLCARGWI